MVTTSLTGFSAASTTAPALVLNGNDSGPGSLRAALAGGSHLVRIHRSVGNILINSTLAYSSSEPLSLIGWGQTIQANNSGDDFTLLEVSNGADLEVRHLNFDGGGGFSLDKPGDGKGIYLNVPGKRTGIVYLKLLDVAVVGVANHGIHVSDCTLGDACGSNSGGGGDGSTASLNVMLQNVTVRDAGNGKFDADGVRIDERNDGGIMLYVFNSVFHDIGADGVELDEGNRGDVYITVAKSFFEGNGGYCVNAPLVLEHPCVENDEGELVLDLDDGFDIDEAGEGSLQGVIADSVVYGNLDEGLDFDEKDEGGIALNIFGVDAIGNADEGVKLSSAHDGNINVDFNRLIVTGNGDDGIQVEAEFGEGEVQVRFSDSRSTGNGKAGLNISQRNTTSPGTLKVRGFSEIDSLDLKNVEEIPLLLEQTHPASR